MSSLFKKVIGFDGYYISMDGRVLSLKTDRFLKPYHHRYTNYQLMKAGKACIKSAHRLIAENFIFNPENKNEVNHIDGNTKNNCIDNLEWVTSKENQIHAVRNGLQGHKKKRGSTTKIDKRWRGKIMINGITHCKYFKSKQEADKYVKEIINEQIS